MALMSFVSKRPHASTPLCILWFKQVLGVFQEKLFYLGFFEFVCSACNLGKTMLAALLKSFLI